MQDHGSPRKPRYPSSIRLPRELQIEVGRKRRRRALIRPQAAPVLLVGGFALAIAIGTVLLMLPVSSEDGEWTGFVTALFTSTSAVCVTGLVVVDTGTYWSGFGQVVILGLMQIGGLGIITGAVLLFLIFGWRVGMRERIMVRQTMDLGRLTGVARIVRRIAVFVLIIEAIGFVILTVRFAFDEPLHRAAWWGLFHSVSGLNNAGFDLFGEFRSMSDHTDAATMFTISGLFVIGGIGYLVVEELRQRPGPRLSVDTRLILAATALFLALGMVSVLALEWSQQGTLAGMSAPDKLMHSWFQSSTARTAGFSTVSVSEMKEATQVVLIVLMFIGGASGSTAGGIKVGTFALMGLLVWSAARGRQQVEIFGREIRRGDVDRAVALVMMGMAFVLLVVIALTLTEDKQFMDVLFEAASAFGTVGLSTGITPDLSTAGKLIIVVTMFVGRLGPLTLVLALSGQRRVQHRRLAEDRVRVG